MGPDASKGSMTDFRQARLVATALAAAIAIWACTQQASKPAPAAPAPDSPVSTVAPGNPNPTPGQPQASPVVPIPGQQGVRAIAWTDADVAADDTTVTITWWSGVEPCQVLDHIDVRYARDDITITLFEGHTPTREDMACIEIAVLKQTTVQLDEAVAGRKIVDGAKGATIVD